VMLSPAALLAALPTLLLPKMQAAL